MENYESLRLPDQAEAELELAEESKPNHELSPLDGTNVLTQEAILRSYDAPTESTES